ncbi:uncharacterized protein [Rhodnius prolixus]|uniref:uncharacterized protein n=1 Tax=Rhodnius prolixus TaxID=13249 RepID=UPI003D18EA4F
MVWYRNEYSHKFETTMGVKQGALLSPLFFTLFINDIEDDLIGGININRNKIKLLAFADDIAVIALDPVELQYNIHVLEKYCLKWNLKINTNKSKVMVCRNGARPSNKERWSLGNENIEIVNCYKYLGLRITPQLNLNKHLNDKLLKAKIGLNSVWKSFIANSKIPVSAKLEMFNAVSRAIMCYGAQVSGGKSYRQGEQLFTYFIKKLLRLPRNTPNYIITLETNMPPLYIHTLQLHHNYIIKVLSMPNYRYPKIVALETIKRQIYWYKDLCNVNSENGSIIKINFDNVDDCKKELNLLREQIHRNHIEACIIRAQNSQFSIIYKYLNFSFGDESFYFCDKYTTDNISWIIKIRGELLNLNYKRYNSNESQVCSLCSREEIENIIHFICICPAYRDLRLKFLNKIILSQQELIQYLNGDWISLFNYTKRAWILRYQKIHN